LADFTNEDCFTWIGTGLVEGPGVVFKGVERTTGPGVGFEGAARKN